MCDPSGFATKEISYDSTEHQFLGSEQYVRDISIWDKRSYWVDPKDSILTPEHVISFRRKAEELNKIGDGDQALFILGKR